MWASSHASLVSNVSNRSAVVGSARSLVLVERKSPRKRSDSRTKHAGFTERMLDEHGPGEVAVSPRLGDDAHLSSCNHARIGSGIPLHRPVCEPGGPGLTSAHRGRRRARQALAGRYGERLSSFTVVVAFMRACDCGDRAMRGGADGPLRWHFRSLTRGAMALHYT